jgi:FecR protein
MPICLESLVTVHRVLFAGWLLFCFVPPVLAIPSAQNSASAAIAVAPPLRLAQAQQAQPTPPAPAAAPAGANAPPAVEEPIGNVATLIGNATVTRSNAVTSLKAKDDIYQNDVLQTAAKSSLGITFSDATTFNLTANATVTVDSFVYEDGGKQNAALFDVARGTVAFVAAAVAKTGDMKISTPTATLGIRGTSGLVEVPEGAAAAGRSNVAIKLYPDADGKVGRIEVNDRTGARLGFLTQGASGFAIRPGAGMRVAAVPLTISPQQMLRDQGFVRQVHSTQNFGRQIVTQQRDFRRANPGVLNPNRPNRSGQPGGLQRQNGAPGQNNLQNRPAAPRQPQPGLQNQPGQPQRAGAPTQPGAQGQPGAPSRPGATPPGQPQQPPAPGQPNPANRSGVLPPANPQQPAAAQPGLQRPPGIQQSAPGLARPGLQNRPALAPRRPAVVPRGKKEKR